MYFSKITLLLTIPILLTLSGTLSAENAGESIKGRRAYIIYTGEGKFFNKPVSIHSGQKTVERQLSKRRVSQPVKIPKSGEVNFVKPAPEGSKEKFLTYAQARVPENIKKALIVLTPLATAKGERTFKANVLDIANFNKGDWLFINLTPRNIGATVGEQKVAVKPGKTNTFDASRIRKKTNLPVAYSFYNPKKKMWQLLSASTCVIRPQRREICVFSWKDHSNRIDYHGVTFTE